MRREIDTCHADAGMTQVPCTNDTQLWEGLYYPVSTSPHACKHYTNLNLALLLLHTSILLHSQL